MLKESKKLGFVCSVNPAQPAGNMGDSPEPVGCGALNIGGGWSGATGKSATIKVRRVWPAILVRIEADMIKMIGEFGIEWRRSGTLMIGEPWTSRPGGGTVPIDLWPKLRNSCKNWGQS